MPAAPHIFGVRHLSPAGAWHLRQLLDRVRPKLVLIEGSDDADPLIPHIVSPKSTLPIAILAYTADMPVRTFVYPLANYSPEYQALIWCRDHKAKARFIDLPSAVFLALSDHDDGAVVLEGEAPESEDPKKDLPTGAQPRGNQNTSADADEDEDKDEAGKVVQTPPRRLSVYDQIATLAGEPDYETYWERHFEQLRGEGADLNAASCYGQEIRGMEPFQNRAAAENLVREAYMRRKIVAALAEGHKPEEIVVVTGAFHASVLGPEHPPMTDEELGRLRRREARMTLMPYLFFKLSSQSGYGAGNHAPAYFEMVWKCFTSGTLDQLPTLYLTNLVRALREAGTFRSTAEVIEGVRLAEALASLKVSHPTLRDLQDAAVALLGQGDASVIQEARARIEVGTAIGSLAKGVSQTSIQDDFYRELERLKLDKYKSAVASELQIDLRENRTVKSQELAFLDLHRSGFLHRLAVLGVDFGKKLASRQEGTTWKENWRLQWTPEAEIAIVEAVLLGETIELATAFKFKQRLEKSTSIHEASTVIREACECGMEASIELARQTLQRLASDSSDFPALAGATHDLGLVIRYGDVRRFDAAPLKPLLEQLFLEGALALVGASSCDQAAAKKMVDSITELNRISLDYTDLVDEPLWVGELQKVAAADHLNPLLSGYTCALLLERNLISNEELAREVSRRLSPGIEADLGAGWFEGLARRNRYALLTRLALWDQLAQYVAALAEEEFKRALVFLRRAFGDFSAAEKRSITENLGEIWGANPDNVSEVLQQELTPEEKGKLDELKDFNFDDLSTRTMAIDAEQLKRWRLILGHHAQESLAQMGAGCTLSAEQMGMDDALAAIYDETPGEANAGPRSAGLGPSAPSLAKWLGDIRTYFKEDVVTVIQNDAIEKKGLTQLLFEPEMLKNVEPNPQLVGTLMSLKGRIPERTKETARMVVRAVVEKIKKLLEQRIRQAVMGALNRNEHSPIPHAASIDWKWTIGRNLKNYQPSLKTIVPEKVYFFSRAQRSNYWTVIVDMDQSGSMAESVVYGSVTGSIFASLPALNTRVVAFDTEVVDLTEKCGNDPVDMIFGVQLGGGTDINKSVAYCEQFITDPAQTLFFLITDLFEGGNEAQLVRRLQAMVESGVRVICLLALSDSGKPFYDERLAKKISAFGVPCFGCTPRKLPELIEGALKKQDLKALAERLAAKKE